MCKKIETIERLIAGLTPDKKPILKQIIGAERGDPGAVSMIQHHIIEMEDCLRMVWSENCEMRYVADGKEGGAL